MRRDGDRLWLEGALMGSRPEDAYFVRCDATTTTCMAGVALVKPAEFTMFSMKRWET